MNYNYDKQPTNSYFDIGDMSMIESRLAQSKRTNDTTDYMQPCESDKNISTNPNSLLPDQSIIDRTVQSKNSQSLRASTLCPRAASNLITFSDVIAESNEEPQVEPPSPKSILLNLYKTVQHLQRNQRRLEEQFSLEQAQIMREIGDRKRKNKMMNLELAKVRRELQERHRQVTNIINNIKKIRVQGSSSRNLHSPYRETEGTSPRYTVNPHNRHEKMTSHSPQIESETVKEPALPKLPSFKNKVSGNKFFMRF